MTLETLLEKSEMSDVTPFVITSLLPFYTFEASAYFLDAICWLVAQHAHPSLCLLLQAFLINAPSMLC